MSPQEIRQVRGYGWRPSPPDARDVLADTSGVPILPAVDPRGEMTDVYDQGQLGSCTSQAVAAAVDYDRIVSGEQPFHPARLVIYALERIIEGSPLTSDTGAVGRDGLKACRNFGMLPESEYPYSDQAPAWEDDPRDDLQRLGATKLEHPYKAVPRTLHDLQAVLSNRQTIAFGFSVYESFESPEVAKTGVMPHPGRGERQLGGHEVLLVGYLADHPQHALVRNSWGRDWGLGGYFLMPWTILLDPTMSSDFRTIYRPLGAWR
jgi:C1A family cysteine protease